MGKPSWSHVQFVLPEYIGQWQGTRGTETSKYPEEEKTNSDPLSSGERKGAEPKPDACQAGRRCVSGVVGPT